MNEKNESNEGTIVIWTVASEGFFLIINDILNSVGNSSGISIQVENKQRWELDDALKDFELENLPDALIVDSASVRATVAKRPEIFLTLNDFIDPSYFFECAVTAVTSEGGFVYAFPLLCSPIAMYYRSGLLPEDISSCTEWEIFLETAKDWVQSEFPEKELFPCTRTATIAMAQSLGRLYYNEKGEISPDSAEKVFEFYVYLKEEGFIFDGIYDSSFVNDLLSEDRLFCVIGNLAFRNNIEEYSPHRDWKVMRMPKFNADDREASFGGTALMIIDKERDLVNYDFLQALMDNADKISEIASSNWLIPVFDDCKTNIVDYNWMESNNIISFFTDIGMDAAPIYNGIYSSQLNSSFYNNAIEVIMSCDLSTAIQNFERDCLYYYELGVAQEDKLDYIIITQEPKKREYYKYEYFSNNGMIVMAHYVNGVEREIYGYNYKPFFFGKHWESDYYDIVYER